MSRYYDLTLTPPGAVLPVREWTSHPGGSYDPGALNIEFDITAYNFASPMGASTITVEGVSLQDLSGAANISGRAVPFAGMTLKLSGGMKKGLPLANPKQSGVLTTGSVYQAFGNWQGTEMSLSLVIVSSPYTLSMPGNLVLSWPKGGTLSDALTLCLSTAYPGIPVSSQISPNLISPENRTGYFSTLHQLAKTVNEMTIGAVGSGYTAYFQQDSLGQIVYPGVQITYRGGTIYCYDYTVTPAVVQLDFNDLIGQPTWIAPNTIQIKTVLRADIAVGSLIKMPVGYQSAAGLVSTTAAALPSYIRYSSIFQGKFYVQALRHLGNFRGSGEQWATIMNCVPAGSPT